MPSPFESEIRDLESQHLRRRLRTAEGPQGSRIFVDGRELLNFSSNDYLGLAFDPRVIRGAQAAAEQWGTGAGASRLVSGSSGIHEELERRLAAWTGNEATLVFPSGFQANLGVIQALVGSDDEIYIDRFVHASLVDGAWATGAKLKVFPHRDVERLEELLSKPFAGKRLIVTDSYFSMDGDRAPLRRLVEICEAHGALLMVDEAHALGVYGQKGRGLLDEEGLVGRAAVVTGTLSKALGSQGGFVAGTAAFKDFLVNKARTFIYTTGVSPLVCGAALASLDLIESSDDLRLQLCSNVVYARNQLAALGLNLADSEGPILPIVIGDTERVMKLSERLLEDGILAVAIRPPTVPTGTDRIRLTVTAKHTHEDIDRLVAAFKKHL